jgi:hypothetical protein
MNTGPLALGIEAILYLLIVRMLRIVIDLIPLPKFITLDAEVNIGLQ